MFVGTYEHRLDEKGRIVLPSRFRQGLGRDVVASVGMQRCVSIYPQTGWESLLEKLDALPLPRAQLKDFMRVLFATANEIQLDGAGRMIISPFLREHAALNQELCIIGNGDHVEIWDRERWTSHQEKVLAEDFSAIARELGGL
ncbi:division/cell wall cluster transcriptional repressor MraZ [Aminiphilus sp.]|jgi:MraZ protein|uniref:division/cell wall cluster transcriptional repressor MraZ n=1 Tax=Aminiphilus sp. TaxID=1872488 RepID=UPI0026375DA1|nr:division/cell wall cluster transcriptional repressor MraZ [Aminiphilus sp.]